MQKLLEMDPALKAIVSSWYSDDVAMANYLSLGIKSYLKKPMTSPLHVLTCMMK